MGIVGYKKTGVVADRSTAWSKDMAGSDLPNFTWYKDKELVSTFKLLHHSNMHGKKVVWNGLKGASGEVQGARGGTSIPSADMPGVRSHLQKHYHEFEGEKAPWERADVMYPEEMAGFMDALEEQGVELVGLVASPSHTDALKDLVESCGLSDDLILSDLPDKEAETIELTRVLTAFVIEAGEGKKKKKPKPTDVIADPDEDEDPEEDPDEEEEEEDAKLPTKKPGEQEKDFISRCMSDLKDEFPDQKQRFAVCEKQLKSKGKKGKAETDATVQDDLELAAKDDKEEKLPLPKKGEQKNDFVARCMGHKEMKGKHDDHKKRFKACHDQWNKGQGDKAEEADFETFNRSCANRHLGAWAIEPEWFNAHFAAFTSGQLPEYAFESEHHHDEPELPYDMIADEIALIHIDGQMSKSWSKFGGCSMMRTRKAIRCAAKDDEVKAILMVIDSPGGTVAGLSDLIYDVRQAGLQKPVYVHIEDLCASAAYMTASIAKRITANELAQVGGIGTFALVCDTSGKLRKDGIKAILITSGGVKGQGAPGIPVSSDYIAERQEIIDKMNDYLIGAVAAGRRISPETVAEWNDGRVFLADDARTMGLIDGVMPRDRAVELIKMDLAQAEPVSTQIAMPDGFTSIEGLAQTMVLDALQLPPVELTDFFPDLPGDQHEADGLTLRVCDGFDLQAEEAREPTPCEWGLISHHVNTAKVRPEHLLVKSFRLSDDRVNRRQTRFEKDDLETLASVITKRGIPLTRDHAFNNSEKKFGRIFNAKVFPTPDGGSDLIGSAFIPNREPYLTLLRDLDEGVQKEGSLSYAFKSPQCSICREDLSKPNQCQHKLGMVYETAHGKQPCTVLKKQPFDAYEFSLVTTGYTPRAGVVAADGGASPEPDVDWLDPIISTMEEHTMTKQVETTQPPVENPIQDGIEQKVTELADRVDKLAAVAETQQNILTKFMDERLGDLLGDSPKGRTHLDGDGKHIVTGEQPPGIIHRGNPQWNEFKKAYMDSQLQFEAMRVRTSMNQFSVTPTIIQPWQCKANVYWREHMTEVFDGFLGEFPNFFAGYVQSDAVTTSATVPDEFLAVLSTIVREPSDFQFIFHQFTIGAAELGRQSGDTV